MREQLNFDRQLLEGVSFKLATPNFKNFTAPLSHVTSTHKLLNHLSISFPSATQFEVNFLIEKSIGRKFSIHLNIKYVAVNLKHLSTTSNFVINSGINNSKLLNHWEIRILLLYRHFVGMFPV